MNNHWTEANLFRSDKVDNWLNQKDRLNTDLDGDVDCIDHNSAVLRCRASLSAGRAVHGVGDLENADDRQLVEGRSAAVQNYPLT